MVDERDSGKERGGEKREKEGDEITGRQKGREREGDEITGRQKGRERERRAERERKEKKEEMSGKGTYRNRKRLHAAPLQI